MKTPSACSLATIRDRTSSPFALWNIFVLMIFSAAGPFLRSSFPLKHPGLFHLCEPGSDSSYRRITIQDLAHVVIIELTGSVEERLHVGLIDLFLTQRVDLHDYFFVARRVEMVMHAL